MMMSFLSNRAVIGKLFQESFIICLKEDVQIFTITRGSQSIFSCFLVPTDNHQGSAAVLCSSGQELSILLREGEDSQYLQLQNLFKVNMVLYNWLFYC